MNKTMMQLAVTGLVLACATTVFAGSFTSRLQAGDCVHQVDGGIHAKAYGYVVIKAVGRGYDVTYQLWNAAPSYSYYAQTAGQFFGYLKTDAQGKGSLTVRVTTDPKTWGYWLGLRETKGQLSTCTNPLPPYVPQSLWAAPNPFNPLPPGAP
jgi:hypothetical protein